MSAEKTARSVRLHLAMKDGELRSTIKKFLSAFAGETKLSLVEDANEADIIIFTEDIGSKHNKEKKYVFLDIRFGRKSELPKNCVVVRPTTALVADIIKLIDDLGREVTLARKD